MQNNFIELLNYNTKLFSALIIFIGINYITSIFVMIVEKKWLKEKLGIKSILGKIGSLLLIYISHIIGVIIIDNATLCNMVISFYLSREGIEILDNLEHLGVPLPSIIIKIIKQLNNGDEEDKNTLST